MRRISTVLKASYSVLANKMGSKKALIVVANGSEEIESVTPIDTLRRAGVQVTVANFHDERNPVTCSRNVILGTEKTLSDALKEGPYDAILLPGGLKGAESFRDSDEIGKMLQNQEASGRLIAAICAAPIALKKHGIGKGKALTSYPAMKDVMTEGTDYKYMEQRVVVDGPLITSRGPGTALEWSLAISEYLAGKEKANEVANAMLLLK